MSTVVRIHVRTPNIEATKAIKYNEAMTVAKVMELVRERTNITPEEAAEYVLSGPDGKIFQPHELFQSYGPNLLESIYYKPRPRYITAVSADSLTRNKVLVDFHVPVATLLPTIVAHIGQIDTPLSPEKYILKLESTGKELDMEKSLAKQNVAPDEVILVSQKKKKRSLSKLGKSMRKISSSGPASFTTSTSDSPTASSPPSLRRGTSFNRKPVFGVPLSLPQPSPRSKYLDGQGYPNKKKRFIPMPVRRMLEYIEKIGVHTEGIFRVSPSMRVVEDYKNAIELDNSFDFECISDPHIVSSLIKLYIRSLPEPLIPWPIFLKLQSTSPEEFETKLPGIMEELPEPNRKFLARFLKTLNIVAQHVNENLMTPENLAVVISPCFINQGTETYNEVTKMTGFQTALAYMISHRNQVFPKSSKQRSSPHISPSASSSYSDSIETQDQSIMRRSTIINLANLVTRKYSINNILFFARADFEFVPEMQFEVPLKEGNLVAVFSEDEAGWWLGKVIGSADEELSPADVKQRLADETHPVGLFPSTYCTKLSIEATSQMLGRNLENVTTEPEVPAETESPMSSIQNREDELNRQIAELKEQLQKQSEELLSLQSKSSKSSSTWFNYFFFAIWILTLAIAYSAGKA